MFSDSLYITFNNIQMNFYNFQAEYDFHLALPNVYANFYMNFYSLIVNM